jgi:N6-adenosine-specific RNA methylase IME4
MSEIPMPEGEYDLIYADPPWSYDQDTPRGGVAHEYETMTHKDICALDVPAADDAILYLWTTVTHAQEAFEVLESWGFEYKTQAVWDKQQYGIGHWFRGTHELLYVATRGDVSPPDSDARTTSMFREQSRGHSRKPACVREFIEEAWPDKRKLELFARDNRVGWEPWGNEVPQTEQQTL